MSQSDLLRFRGGGVASTSAPTTPTTAIELPLNVRGAVISLTASARIGVTSTATPFAPTATNLGYVDAGPHTIVRHPSDTHIHIAGDGAAVTFKIAWVE